MEVQYVNKQRKVASIDNGEACGGQRKWMWMSLFADMKGLHVCVHKKMVSY